MTRARTARALTGDDYVAPTALPLPPDSVTWEVGALGIVGASRALLLQTSHPLVAAGVAEHSDYARDPWSRLYRTFDTILKLLWGDPALSRRQTTRMAKRHAPVTGTDTAGRAYDARDPELGLWVWATLVDTSLLCYERVHGRLRPRDRERFYEEQKLFADGVGVPRDLVPPTIAEFEAYVARVVARDLEPTPEGRDVARFTFRPPGSGVARALGALNTWSAAALFPPRVREMYGLEWTAGNERVFRAVLRAVAVADRLTPHVLSRRLPVSLVVEHDLLARLERRTVARRAAHRRAGAA